jgi:predicted DNA-binding transcriptional regulator AlpA
VVSLVPILLYDRFKDEAEFRDSFVKPLLNRLGFYGVSEQQGSQEFGKDFVFSELHRLGGMKHYAAQVARITCLSLASVRRWRLLRQGPKYLKLGAAVRYRNEDIAAWLKSRPTGGTQAEQ